MYPAKLVDCCCLRFLLFLLLLDIFLLLIGVVFEERPMYAAYDLVRCCSWFLFLLFAFSLQIEARREVKVYCHSLLRFAKQVAEDSRGVYMMPQSHP